MYIISSLLLALAVGWFASTVMRITHGPRLNLADYPHFEAERRKRLRGMSSTYRHLEPLIDEYGTLIRQVSSPARLSTIDDHLSWSGDRVPWLSHEFLAASQIEGTAGGLLTMGLISIVNWKLGFLLGVIGAIVYYTMAKEGLKRKASDRRNAVKRRLPFAVDLMALVIGSGGTFRGAIDSVIDENEGHPLAEEFDAIREKLNSGQPQAVVLRRFQQRFDDPDITEFVVAINNGDELGTPLAKILSLQADQMRLKRAQWGEKAAAEAEVAMTMPSLLTMMACILVVLAPFVIPAIQGWMKIGE